MTDKALDVLAAIWLTVATIGLVVALTLAAAARSDCHHEHQHTESPTR